ncbi:MAG: Calcium binding [Anaerolineales bacterium]|nr:Calcium binding [Anaerolineales bacterium]
MTSTREIHDIPRLRSQDKREAELFVDCYGDAEAAGALHVYLSDALDYAFEAEWRVGGRQTRITVLALAEDWDDEHGLMFRTRVGNRARLVPAHQVFSLKSTGRVATVLNDYRDGWPYDVEEE